MNVKKKGMQRAKAERPQSKRNGGGIVKNCFPDRGKITGHGFGGRPTGHLEARRKEVDDTLFEEI